MRSTTRATTAFAVIALLALSACTDDGDAQEEQTTPEADQDGLVVHAASFDLHVGEQQRLLLGLVTPDNGMLVHGDVEIEIGPMGDPDEGDPTDTGAAVVEQSTTASFLPVPGDAPEGGGSQPTVLVGESGRGLYEAFVDLDEPGFWAVQVTAELADGTTRTGSTRIPDARMQPDGVHAEPEVLDVGDEAPLTENLTVDDVDEDEVLSAMVDSRAGEGEVPDTHIHDSTIAEGIEQGRPVVALFATPVYCQSLFCGPITERFASLAEQYRDRADFVHVEVWKDFDAGELNEAAAEWIATADGGNEPWTFVIDEDGRIAARWDNILDEDALVSQLEQLPAMTHSEAGDED